MTTQTITRPTITAKYTLIDWANDIERRVRVAGVSLKIVVFFALNFQGTSEEFVHSGKAEEILEEMGIL